VETVLNVERELLAAEGYFDLGLPGEALAILQSLPTQARGDLRIRNLLVSIQISTEDWAGAAETACNLVHDEPEDAQHWIHLAYAIRRRENVSEAEKILLRAVRVHPREWCIRYNLACYAAVQGRKEEAAMLFEEAVALEPSCEIMAQDDPDLIILRSHFKMRNTRFL
jgi:Flp pilus assembly protein TadD